MSTHDALVIIARFIQGIEWYAAGVAALWLACKVAGHRLFPHRHGGYVSYNGYVWTCARCGKLPPGTYRPGFGGTEPPAERH